MAAMVTEPHPRRQWRRRPGRERLFAGDRTAHAGTLQVPTPHPLHFRQPGDHPAGHDLLDSLRSPQGYPPVDIITLLYLEISITIIIPIFSSAVMMRINQVIQQKVFTLIWVTVAHHGLTLLWV